MKTKMTEILGIKYPIIQGGLQWLGLPELASAVSNAGALGVINALSFADCDELAAAIAKTKSMTKNPFAVNVSMLPGLPSGNYLKNFQAIVDGGVKVVETSGKIPTDFLPMLKKAGVKVIHKVASVRHALKTEQAGVDFIELVGFECGGHPGMDDVATSVLIPKATSMLKTPVIAGGGIADGRGLVAALSWGAEGVVMGTRFVATTECPIHENFKKMIASKEETDTTVIQYTIKNPLRAVKNKSAIKVLEMEKEGTTLEKLMPIIGGANNRRSYKEGDLEGATFSMGQCAGLIRDIKPAKDVVEEIMAGARAALDRLAKLK